VFYATFAVWAACAAGGLVYLSNYENRPGLASNPPVSWPRDSRIVRATDRPTLILTAHPQCPCTKASLGEIAEVLARLSHPLKTVILFIRPTEFPEGWEQTELWRRATALPGVTVMVDAGGVEASRFGAATSGETLLYDETGTLLFSGGITGSRGHPGDNIGRAELMQLLNREAAEGRPTSVFGCPLFANGRERI